MCSSRKTEWLNDKKQVLVVGAINNAVIAKWL